MAFAGFYSWLAAQTKPRLRACTVLDLLFLARWEGFEPPTF